MCGAGWEGLWGGLEVCRCKQARFLKLLRVQGKVDLNFAGADKKLTCAGFYWLVSEQVLSNKYRDS